MPHIRLFVKSLPESRRGLLRFSSLFLVSVVLTLAGCKQAAGPSLSKGCAPGLTTITSYRLGSNWTGTQYPRALSVRKYNLITRRNEPVLNDVGKGAYRVEGTVEGKALIVSVENVNQSPRYVLQARRLDGSHPVPLTLSEKGVAFIGWLR